MQNDRLCHNTGGKKKSADHPMMQVSDVYNLNSSFAPVVDRREIWVNFISWCHKCHGTLGWLLKCFCVKLSSAAGFPTYVEVPCTVVQYSSIY